MNGNKFEIVVSKIKNLDFLLTILKKKKNHQQDFINSRKTVATYINHNYSLYF